MDFAAYREVFPVTQHGVYLNNAAETPLNTRVRQRLEEYLQVASDAPQDKPSVRHAVRAALSDLFGGVPEDYALVTSTGATEVDNAQRSFPSAPSVRPLSASSATAKLVTSARPPK